MNRRIRAAQVRDEYDNVWDDSWLPLRIANQVIMIHYNPGDHARMIHHLIEYVYIATYIKLE